MTKKEKTKLLNSLKDKRDSILCDIDNLQFALEETEAEIVDLQNELK